MGCECDAFITQVGRQTQKSLAFSFVICLSISFNHPKFDKINKLPMLTKQKKGNVHGLKIHQSSNLQLHLILSFHTIIIYNLCTQNDRKARYYLCRKTPVCHNNAPTCSNKCLNSLLFSRQVITRHFSAKWSSWSLIT